MRCTHTRMPQTQSVHRSTSLPLHRAGFSLGEEDQAEGAAVEEDMESMPTWRPLSDLDAAHDLSMLSSYFDIEQDLLLSCGELSPTLINIPCQENWSLDDRHEYPTCESNSYKDSHAIIHHTTAENNDSSFEGVIHDSCKYVENLDERERNTQPAKSSGACKPINDPVDVIKKSLVQNEHNKRQRSYIWPSASSKQSALPSMHGKGSKKGAECNNQKGSIDISNRRGDHGDLVIHDSIRKSSYDRVKSRFSRRSTVSASGSLKEMHEDSSENSDDEGSNYDCEKSRRKGSTSKNLVSERRRRQKLNERLYSLRALVPNISKMDKASIVGDAIEYVRDLKKQVEDMEEDIAQLEACKEDIENGRSHPFLEHKGIPHVAGRHIKKPIGLVHQILELDVTQMEEKLFQFRIHCKKTPGVLLQLTRALEALDIEIVNGSLTSINDHILNTLVIEVDGAHRIRSEDLRAKTLAVIPRFGLFL